jgi:hypothetical protein
MPNQIPVSLLTALKYILKCQHRLEICQQPIHHIKTTIAPKALLEYLLLDTLHLYQSCIQGGQVISMEVRRDCGILNMLEPGDDVRAVRSFDIEGDMPDGLMGLNLISHHF